MTDTAIRFSLILGMIVSASLFVEIRLRARQSRKDGRRGLWYHFVRVGNNPDIYPRPVRQYWSYGGIPEDLK